jgi:hypothetical protein
MNDCGHHSAQHRFCGFFETLSDNAAYSAHYR